MKILLVTYKNDYDRSWNVTTRFYSAAYFLWYPPLASMSQKRRYEFRTFWVDEVIRERGRSESGPALLKVILEEKPEVVIVYGCEYDLNVKCLQEIKEKSSAVTIYFCGDDSWSLDSVSRYYAPYFSWTVTWCSGAVEKYHALGIKNIIGSQVWVDTELYQPVSKDKKIDVSFVGTINQGRVKVVESLRKAGINILVRGNGWPEGSVSQEEMLRIISESKISLSLNSPAFHFGFKPVLRLFFRRAFMGEKGISFKFDGHHFLRNLRAWLQKRARQIKGRTFEIPACNTLAITQTADNLEDYYEPDKEILIYRDVPDLIEKIRYFLAHPEEREVIAERGYRRTLRDHTFERRINQIFLRTGIIPE